jgi:hypothetical protein
MRVRVAGEAYGEDYTMKLLLTGVAVAAALVIAAPVWAQNSTPTPAPAPVQSMNRMPAGGTATSERGSGARAHHRRHAAQSAGKSSAGSQADQLNRQELSQLQGTNPTTMNRMSVGGRATSGGPNQ